MSDVAPQSHSRPKHHSSKSAVILVSDDYNQVKLLFMTHSAVHAILFLFSVCRAVFVAELGFVLV